MLCGRAQGALTLLHINDIYCDVAPINGVGGYAELCTFLKSYRNGTDSKVSRINGEDYPTVIKKKHENVIVSVGGDILGGSQLTQVSRGEFAIHILNECNVDISLVGKLLTLI